MHRLADLEFSLFQRLVVAALSYKSDGGGG
jgi:hypothetical protein